MVEASVLQFCIIDGHACWLVKKKKKKKKKNTDQKISKQKTEDIEKLCFHFVINNRNVGRNL